MSGGHRHWNPGVLLMGIENAVAIMENRMEVPQKVKNKMSMWAINSYI